MALVALTGSALVVVDAGGAAAAPRDGEVIPGAYIVTLDAGEPEAVARDHGRRHGAAVDHVYRSALQGYAARMSASAAGRIAGEAGVASVVPDRAVVMTAKPGGGGGGTPAAQTTPTGITRIGGAGTLPTSGVDVAVIDTGSGPHSDLNVVGGKNCSSGTSHADGNGHGTHVAGTIGAKDDGAGVVGVAPGARIWSVRVLNNAGSGSWSSIICGIDWVANFNDTARPTNYGKIEVANMSLGGTGTDTGCDDGGMHAAICNLVGKGVTVVVAAGNESDDAKNHVPSSYDEVITVSALADSNGAPGGTWPVTACRSDQEDTLADFSNFGPDVDLIAPGVCILSTWKGGGYNTISGTSMAAPHVAGAAALYKAKNTGASPAQVLSALQTAGNLDWNNVDDGDAIKERLLHVAAP